MSLPAADPWGFDLEDIQLDVPSPLTDIRVMSPPAADPWGGMDLEDIRIDVASPPIVVTSPNASDIRVSLPVNHTSGDMHFRLTTPLHQWHAIWTWKTFAWMCTQLMLLLQV